jgi:hypothetical protein
MGRGWIVVGLVAALLWCAPSFAPSADADDRPLISADRIGPRDDDEPARDSDDHYLSPAERDALAAQGYELQIDDKIVTQTRIQPSQKETEPTEPKGPIGRAMDSVGKGMVAVASVALPLAIAVAPFFLM